MSNAAVEAAINAERAEDSPDRARTPPTIQRSAGTKVHANGRPLASDSSSSAAISSYSHDFDRRDSENSQTLHSTTKLQPSNSGGTIPVLTPYELPIRRLVVESSYTRPHVIYGRHCGDIAIVTPAYGVLDRATFPRPYCSSHHCQFLSRLSRRSPPRPQPQPQPSRPLRHRLHGHSLYQRPPTTATLFLTTFMFSSRYGLL